MARARSPSAAARRSPSPAAKPTAKPAAKPAARAAARGAADIVTTEFEFLGPTFGPAFIVLSLPLLVLGSAFYLRGAGWSSIPAALPTLADLEGCFSWRASAVFCGWFAFQAALYLLVPGPTGRGTALRDGSRLDYPLNAWRCLLVTAAALAAVHARVAPLTWVLDNFVQLAGAATAFSFALSAYLYARSFAARGAALAAGGNSGRALYDFFIGRELNPRALGIDLKFFCELRPGLFAWLVIVAAAVLREVEVRGAPTPAMLVVAALQALYVADAVWSEEAILTTMDITTDGFGFMLAFGDLAWVPAMYSLQARYLADAGAGAPAMSPLGAAAAGAVGLAGYAVFRAANAQKDLFKREPRAAAVRDLPTVGGGRLLAGGWWGVARHVNYLADIVLSIGMSLPTGFATPVTYFYPAYFAVLLWHRELRDDEKCHHKYGAAWEEYRKRVPWRIIPYVY